MQGQTHKSYFILGIMHHALLPFDRTGQWVDWSVVFRRPPSWMFLSMSGFYQGNCLDGRGRVDV